MTCIVGTADGSHVWLGADSLVSSGENCAAMHEPKVFRVGRGGIAVAGEAAWALTLAHKFAWPARRGLAADAYMVRCVRPALRKLWETDYDGSDYISWLLLAYKGSLYSVDTNFMPFRADYAAEGSGGAVALGALRVARGAPVDRILTALEAAEAHTPTVRRPWVTLRC